MEGLVKEKSDVIAQEIETRVEKVESYLVDIQSAIGNKYLTKELTKGKPLLYRIDNIERSINQIIKSNKLDELFSKLLIFHLIFIKKNIFVINKPSIDTTLKKLIDVINDKIKTSAIDTDAKLDIILISENELIETSNKIKEIKSLQQYINSKEYTKIEELLPQFSICQNENRKIKEELNFLTQKIYKCLDEYNIFTERISEIFIWYNNLLTEIELKILEIEKNKKESY
ncbi:hypothetical protein BCR36DRAFT_106753 [Piromyces finnis]|uniref:Uncharacterized protein n=1 Tax=Piromyces finnis TaxID=1754191 RepID=A0A1Y1V2S4_9FUNG|nr:hypothetical protein BCR36DRAFT_106753 [Piromyces finnis]|eukprot:ORX45963.1 hypothetical protein BCR36DRAFT_106753 [Piromyces finnis]